MKVAIVTSMAPFVWGGAEELALNLASNLGKSGHQAHVFRIPFAWDPFESIPVEMARSRLLRFSAYDRVISMKFPVYLCEAERHTTWLVHQYRQAYDLWGTPYGNIPDTHEGNAVRQIVINSDNAALGSRPGLFTISTEVGRRLEQFNGISAPALRAPINDPELFTGGRSDAYILAPGRINASKRQSLLVEAMADLGKDSHLIVAGPPESERDAQLLRSLVQDHGLEGKVTLDLRFLSRNELADYVNRCRAVAYLPFQEDSYGYVTMEAFEAGKPVITCDDAGELLEIVKNGQTGIVCAPNRAELAQAIAKYLERPPLAIDHGRAGQSLWRSLNINWQGNIERLLGNCPC